MAAVSHPLLRLLATDPKRVVGLVPGVTLDGPNRIDAALVEITGSGSAARARLLHFVSVPLPPGLGELVAALLDPSHASSAAELSTVNFRLGHALAEAAAIVAGDEPIDLVGSPGVTVWHQPPWMKTRADLPASTLQLGEAAVIAARIGAVTVADFRAADVAVAGEGAPLVPYADWVLFRRAGRVRALQEIGAVSNVTVVSDRLADVIAFDNGPGILAIDALAARVADADLEQQSLPSRAGDGVRELQAGQVLPDVLARLLDDDYLRRPPPRSAGRERYGRGFVDELVRTEARAAPIDLWATQVAFTAEAIAHSYRSFVLPRAPLDEVLVSGAGSRNATLMAQLGRLLAPLPVRALDASDAANAAHDPATSMSIMADAKEAVAFALLAVEAAHAQPANLPAATGARRPAILGKLCLPPPG